jgi:hypothetical protein
MEASGIDCDCLTTHGDARLDEKFSELKTACRSTDLARLNWLANDSVSCESERSTKKKHCTLVIYIFRRANGRCPAGSWGLLNIREA